MKISEVRINDIVRCKYPRHGNLNILCSRQGEVVRKGTNKDGIDYITVRTGNKYRTFRDTRIVDLEACNPAQT